MRFLQRILNEIEIYQAAETGLCDHDATNRTHAQKRTPLETEVLEKLGKIQGRKKRLEG